MGAHWDLKCPRCKSPLTVPLELAYHVVAVHRGKAGGKARAARMTPEERSEACRRAGQGNGKPTEVTP